MTESSTTTLNALLERIRPEVRAQHAYRVPTNVNSGAKLDQNESPFGLPLELREALRGLVSSIDWNRYPDDRPHRLIEALRIQIGLPKGSIIVGRGSNELTHTIGLAFVQRGASIVLPDPMFALFKSVVGINGGSIVSVPPEEDLRHSPERILQAAQDSDAALVIVTTPNNPTGQTIDPAGLRLLAEGVPGFLLVDEAYHEFFNAPPATQLLRDHPNVLVMRTFSKALGMAGLRIGYLCGHPDVIAELEKARLPFLVDRLSEEAALLMLQHREATQRRVDQLLAARRTLEKEVSRLPGVRVVPGSANFFLLSTPIPPADLMAALAERDVLIRNVSSYSHLQNFVRVSVGTESENRTLLLALQGLLQNAGERSATVAPS